MNWCIWIWLWVGRAACMWEALIVVRRRRLGTLDLEDRESVVVVLLLGIYREYVVWPLGVSIAKGGRWTWSIIGWNDRLEHVLQRHSCKVAVARLGVCIIEEWQLKLAIKFGPWNVTKLLEKSRPGNFFYLHWSAVQMELPLTVIADTVGSGSWVGNLISNWMGSLLYIWFTICSGLPVNLIFP